MKKLVIFGANSMAKQIYAFLSYGSPYEITAFTVNEKYIKEKTLFGLDVVPFERIEEMLPPDRFAMFVAIGYKKVNKARAEVYNKCKSKGYELISHISPSTGYWGHVEIGDNTIIVGGTIKPFAKIGNDCIIGTALIGHDSIIGDHCFFASHVMISGNVKIGDYCFIGANATISDGVTIASDCVIGAGAVILKDTERGGVYPGQNSQIASKMSHELKYFK